MAQLSKQRVTGTVKWFNGQKGFGFISPDDGGEDLFVHQTSIKTEGFRVLNEGDSVEFVVERGGDGRTKAVDVVTNSEGSAMSGVGGGRGGGRGFSVGRGRGFGRGGGRRGGRMSGGGGACYNCGKSGHLARDCTQQGGGGGGVRYGSGGGGGGGGCYNCGGYGHLARECPNN